MNIKALQLLSTFSLPPNSLGYCGRDSAPEKFKKCVVEGECDEVEPEVGNFIVLNPYLKVLSDITGLDKYSYEVSEAYWIGNRELEKTKQEHYNLLLKYFSEQGVPIWLTDELLNKVPKKFIPTHLFQILHVGVGRASGAVPFNIENINNCMIRWGEVVTLEDNFATVQLNSLEGKDDKYKLVTRKEIHPYLSKLVPGIKRGDIAVVHWKQLIKILDQNEQEKIHYWTNKVLENFS